jgi:hypothetical protein
VRRVCVRLAFVCVRGFKKVYLNMPELVRGKTGNCRARRTDTDTDTDTFMRAAFMHVTQCDYTTTVNYTVTNALKDMTYGPLYGGWPLRELQPTTPLHVAYSRTYWTRSHVTQSRVSSNVGKVIWIGFLLELSWVTRAR